MHRRNFLFAGASAFFLGSARDPSVRVSIDENRPLGNIPADFVGLGYEITSVARPGLLCARNRAYVDLLRALGPAGVLRVGGITSDYARYEPGGKPLARSKGAVVSRASLGELRGFCRATGWRLIWGLNLGEGTPAQAVEEALAVTEILGPSLLAFEIGNEPDLFPGEGHRKGGYTFADYLRQYRGYKTAVRARLPQAKFAGPDAAGQTAWVREFAEAEAGDLALLTHHYYRGQQSPASSFDLLLRPDPKLASMLEGMQRASVVGHGVPYRICETSSFSGGGRPGVSGTFGAALWVLDYFWQLLSYGAAGVNLQTGINQLDFVSSYSPIDDQTPEMPKAKPEYYGMLAFSQGARGRRVKAEVDANGLNLTGYAALAGRRVLVTIINKDRSGAADVEVTCKALVRDATAMRLTAPSIESTNVSFGGNAVSTDGRWTPGRPEPVRVANGKARLTLPPASAAVLTLES